MRNMSFFLTKRQYVNRTKTVTRRLGWKNLKPGEVFMGVLKGQGIPKGFYVQKFHTAVCVSNRSEPLNAITLEDCLKEGFPEMSPAQFVEMFCKCNKCTPETIVQRIEFRHL